MYFLIVPKAIMYLLFVCALCKATFKLTSDIFIYFDTCRCVNNNRDWFVKSDHSSWYHSNCFFFFRCTVRQWIASAGHSEIRTWMQLLAGCHRKSFQGDWRNRQTAISENDDNIVEYTCVLANFANKTEIIFEETADLNHSNQLPWLFNRLFISLFW